jgi:hypothetical protein
MDIFQLQPNAKRFRIYCIYHKFLTEEAYKDLSANYIEKYIRFVGVNAQIQKKVPERLKPYSFEERILANYDPFLQFNRFCESSVFYHIYRNQQLLLEPFEYVGCVQYDMVLSNSLIECLETNLEKNKYQSNMLFYHFVDKAAKHLLNSHGYIIDDKDKNQKIWKSETMVQPHWEQIVALYNMVFKTNHILHTIIDLDFPLYHTFFLHKQMFQKMMYFASFAIPRIFEMLDFNTRHLPYHIERCHGLFLLFQKLEGHLPIWIQLPGIEHRNDLKDPWQEEKKSAV